jgi:hypothetical protein
VPSGCVLQLLAEAKFAKPREPRSSSFFLADVQNPFAHRLVSVCSHSLWAFWCLGFPVLPTFLTVARSVLHALVHHGGSGACQVAGSAELVILSGYHAEPLRAPTGVSVLLCLSCLLRRMRVSCTLWQWQSSHSRRSRGDCSGLHAGSFIALPGACGLLCFFSICVFVVQLHA